MSDTQILQEQKIARVIKKAQESGLFLMGDGMIGYKLIAETIDSEKDWNLMLGDVVPDGFEFTEDFFSRHGISPASYDFYKWSKMYE